MDGRRFDKAARSRFAVLLSALALLLTGGAVGAGGPARAQAGPPPGLYEEFVGDVATLDVGRACDDEATSTLTYRVSGVATGTYPGTFTETGTVVLGPLVNSSKQIQSLTASFTIDSPVGQVTGTKVFVGGTGVNSGACQERFGLPPRATVIASGLRFAATIATPDGRSCATEGSSRLYLAKDNAVVADAFEESFANDVADGTAVVTCGGGGGEEPPVAPATKDDCKDGGHAAYGFRNQGECVRSVNQRD